MIRLFNGLSDAIQVVLYYAISWTLGLMVWGLIAFILSLVFGPVLGVAAALILFFSRE